MIGIYDITNGTTITEAPVHLCKKKRYQLITLWDWKK